MGFTNSSLVVHTKLSPNNSGKRTAKIDTFTPHVVVGHISLKNLGAWFAKESTQASSNYGVDDEGQIGLFVEEKNRSWCTSSGVNDHRAITVEIASDAKHPYAITNGAMDGLIKLGVDVCKRNGIPKLLWKADKNLIGKVDQQNITSHRWFSAKACPGDYLFGRLGEVAEEVNKILVPAAIVVPTSGFPYQVTVNTEVLHYRSGPGTKYPIVGQIRKGEVYTIIEEALGLGSSKWGRLKSGAGWIALDYCMKVR
ncbi:MAG: N-acetylmuramoyl-L-alanine amidase [Fibrobacteraceae bacterium]